MKTLFKFIQAMKWLERKFLYFVILQVVFKIVLLLSIQPVTSHFVNVAMPQNNSKSYNFD